MSDYAGFLWCPRCEKFAPWEGHGRTGSCVPTRRAVVVDTGRSLVGKLAPWIGPTLAEILDAGVRLLEAAPLKRQGVWYADEKWWAEVDGFTRGPFPTTAAAITAYFDGRTERTRRAVSVVDESTDSLRWEDARGHVTPFDEDPRAPGESLGEEVAVAPPAIQVFRRGPLVLLRQESSVLHMPWESVRLLIAGLEKAVPSRDDAPPPIPAGYSDETESAFGQYESDRPPATDPAPPPVVSLDPPPEGFQMESAEDFRLRVTPSDRYFAEHRRRMGVGLAKDDGDDGRGPPAGGLSRDADRE